jgi:hypothetical protein
LPSLPLLVHHDGVDVLRGERPSLYYVVPRVQPERAPDGHPTLVLFRMPGGGLLHAAAELDIDAPRLDAVRAAAQAAAASADPVALTPAPITIGRASLVLTTSAGRVAIADVRPAGRPPYTALFRAALTAEQAAIVEAALRGERGRMEVVYVFDIRTTAGARICLEGHATDTPAIGPPVTDTSGTWVDRALAAGALRMAIKSWGPDAESVVTAAVASAKSEAAAFVSAAETGGRSGGRPPRISIEVRLDEPRSVPATRAGDVAEWFDAGKTASIVTMRLPNGTA